MAAFQPVSLADIYTKAEGVKNARQVQDMRGKQMEGMDRDAAARDIMLIGQFSDELQNSPDPVNFYNQAIPQLQRLIQTPQLRDGLKPSNDPQQILQNAQQASQLARSFGSRPEVKQFFEAQGESGPEIVGVTAQGGRVATGVRPANTGDAKTREIYKGNEVVQEQFNSASGQWEEIGRGSRFSPGSPSVEKEIISIIRKIKNGEEPTPAEREAIEIWARSNPIDRLINTMLRGEEGMQVPAQQPTQPPEGALIADDPNTGASVYSTDNGKTWVRY